MPAVRWLTFGLLCSSMLQDSCWALKRSAAAKGGSKASVATVSAKILIDLTDDNDYVVAIFSSGSNAKTDKAVKHLEAIQKSSKHDMPIVKVEDTAEATAYGLDPANLPALLLFDNGIPEFYADDLDNQLLIKKWINEEVRKNDVDILDAKVLRKMAKRIPALAVLFVEKPEDTIYGQSQLQVLCDSFDIALAKVVGRDAIAQFGIDSLPALVYFEREIPALYDDSLDDVSALLEWLEEQRTADTIEEVTEEILQYLVGSKEYVAVFFTGPCDERAKTDQECERVLSQLENIDDEVDSYGITLVTTEDIKYAGANLKVRKFPALGMFRNGHFLLYEGSLENERVLLSWLVDEDTIELPGEIEEVGAIMLNKLLTEEKQVVVFFYDHLTREVRDILEGLESIDEQFNEQDVEFVKCSDEGVAREMFGLQGELPLLVLFENMVPMPFPGDGDLHDEREIYTWVEEVVESRNIPAVDKSVLEKLIDSVEDLVVIFYDSSKKRHQSFVDDIENVDDEAEDMEMIMVRVDNPRTAKEYGLDVLPAVVHYEKGVPNLYERDLVKEEMLPWLHHHQRERFVSKVTGTMLDELIKEREYVAVLFISDKGEPTLVEGLEIIDKELEDLGILLVQTEDDDFMERHKVTTTPALGYYRNGDLIMFGGNIEHEMSVLKFLTDIDNILLANRIEEVNQPLLEHIIKTEKDVFVFLYDEDDGRARKILKKLGGINDNLENDNVLLVRCSDKNVEDVYGIGYVPRLVYFEEQIPEPFVGNLNDEGDILRWISQELEADEIKLLTRSVLEELVKKMDHVTVLFVNDEDHQQKGLVENLEQLHDRLREEGLNVVQLDDADFEEELGLSDLPALVHFSDDVPSIYMGEENNEDIFQWIVKMKTENVIEQVTKEIVATLKEDEEYLAVFFSGDCSAENCKAMEEMLETIDDELEKIGIHFVKTKDVNYPVTAHGIEELPALGLYRNGLFLKFEENDAAAAAEDPDYILKWFVDQDNLRIPGKIEEVNTLLLSYLYESENDIMVLFYDKNDREADEIVEALEQIDETLDAMNISLFKIDDKGAVEQYGLSELPALVYIQNGIPNVYDGSLLNSTVVLSWIKIESNITRINEVTDVVLSKLVEKFDFIAAVFYDMEDDPAVENLQQIADECQEIGLALVKIRDDEEAKRYGLEAMPQLVFFHKKLPSLVMASADEPEEVMDWLTKHKTSPTIEEVTDKMLAELVVTHEYVGVFFQGADCDAEDTATAKENQTEHIDCDSVLAELETIDDELDDIGVILVTTKYLGMASDHGAKDLPALGLFRNGMFVQYNGDEKNERHILKWMTDEETLKIIGVIDEVNLAMLENIIEEENDAFVFFYEEHDPEAHAILEDLEGIDEKLDKQDLAMVKISDPGAKDTFGIEEIPALVYFEDGVPELYSGDLLNDKQVLKWMTSELKQEEIKEISVAMLERLVERGKTMAVLFYDPDAEDDRVVLEELERIDDDCDRFGISFVKIIDEHKAEEFGLRELPGLLYFENKIPSVYDGDLLEEDVLLDWLIQQKTTDTIEEVTDEILEKLVEEEDYLAVFFSGPCDEDDPCAAILKELEEIDGKAQECGIMLVTTEERGLAKQQYDVRSFPSLSLFKNGEHILYEGDLEDELAILEWLTDVETLKIHGKIEEVNADMLEYLVEVEADVVAYLYRENNIHDKSTWTDLERIDDDLEDEKILLVKCSEKGIEHRFGLGVVPVLVYFNDGIPIIYPGEIQQVDAVLKWINLNRKKSVIEEISASILDALITRHSHLLVIFYNENGEHDGQFLKEMEDLDDDCDDISIPMVKINDESKAMQFGVEETPALLYFHKKLPGLFPGNMSNSEEIWKWMSTRKSSDDMQLVSDAMLDDVVDNFDYVSVLFSGTCKETNVECKKSRDGAKETLREIGDDVENLGITMVMDSEKALANKEYNITEFPALALFKNGIFEKYPGGSLANGAQLLKWFSSVETLEIPGAIEKVNADMLRHFIESEDDVLVFFYDAEDKSADEIISELETVDDNLENEAVEFVRCSDRAALAEYGLNMWPALIYFSRGVPSYYYGDLRNDDNILGWITVELQDESLSLVKSIDILDSLLERLEFVAVFYHRKNDQSDQEIVKKLEDMNDEASMHDIVIVLTCEFTAGQIGVEELPALVYYENNVPFLYRGESLEDERKLLEWLIRQRNIASIEEVTDDMLDDIIEEHEFVAVLFTGLCSGEEEEEEVCNRILENLEKVDATLDEHGIVLVATSDLDRAKEHWISKFPALAYYRNGEYVRYAGDVANTKAVLKWLTSEKTINLPGKILKVNALMLSKLVDKSDNLFAFFYEKNDVIAEKVLRQLEEMEDQLEEVGVDLVKISEKNAKEDYDFEDLPALVHFKAAGGSPTVFYGDLRQFESMTQWMDKVSKKSTK